MTDSTAGLRAAVLGAGLGEWAVVGTDGRPRVDVVTPLWHEGDVWLALPYAQRDLALASVAAGRASLALSDARHAAPGTSGALVQGFVELVEDPAGARFEFDLLEQQLRKHAPSRALADSVILRREHWWYVPRLLLRLHVESSTALPARPDPRSAAVLVVVPDGAGPRTAPDVSVVDLPTASSSPLPVPAPDGDALLFSHDASDDLECSIELRVPGHCASGRFVPTEAPALPVLPPLPGPPSLLARWSRQRALRKACEAGLREAGHH
jgi:hypothetical protein